MPPKYEGAEVANAPALVVAVGTSAGGLEALRELFSGIEPTAGMSFIVLQHHEASQTELLLRLLNNDTRLSVVEAQDGATLLPDHVYVVPSACHVRLQGDSLRLTVAEAENADPRTPIDGLFRSLAQAFGPRAVGVVLSGAGSDGTLGVQAISNEGGMTIAQAPEDARYDSMPRSAIHTGVVDHVLPAEQIAETLMAYVGHVVQLAAETANGPAEDSIATCLPEICDLLQRATEHNFKHYKTNTLVRRIQRRMQVLRIAMIETYVDSLRRNPDEVLQLFRELLIGVTSFFRDPESFAALSRLVLVPLLQRRRNEQVRIWVPGCATGEEAYTLAILVREAMEQMPDPPEVQIFATDVDERALSVARQGIYPAGIAEDVSSERLERMFVKRGKRYQVLKELRELCLFSPHNLINDPPFSRLDLISCRNLLIYFGPHLQKKLVPLFHYALRPNGYLFLGPSESIASHKDLFNVIDAKHRISQRKATAIRTSPLLADAGGSRGVRPPDASHGTPPDLHQLMQRILLDEFAPKAVIVTEDGQIVSASGNMDRYLTVTEGTFQNNLVRLARPGLRVGLRAAFLDAIKVRRKVVNDKVSVKVDGALQRVRVTVQPMPRLGEESDLFMIIFQDMGSLLPRQELASEEAAPDADGLIEQLERELSSTREDLEKSIQDLEVANEELKSSNEELLSMNEELQSANEELETSKEEVHATNEALARAHSHLSNLLTSTAIATIFLDESGQIVSFTPSVTQIYNLLPADVGRPLAHLTHRATSMPPLPTLQALSSASDVVEDDVVTPERFYLRRIRRYQTADGKLDGLVITFMDVTDLKTAYAEARRHQRQLQLITDALPVLISYVDAEERYRFNNKAYERWFGLSRDELYGRKVSEILGETNYAIARPHIERALSGQPTTYDSELPSKELGPRYIHAEYVPDHSDTEGVRGYFSLKQDITDYQRFSAALEAAKQVAEDASRAKSDFLANMSHEIRTPMSAILGYTDLLQSHIADPDDLACIDAIRRNGKHLMELLNDILDLSKVESGKLQAERLRISPGGLLRDVVDSVRVRAQERGLSLQLTHDGPLPTTIESDPTRLRQILLNLLSNAIKFTEEGGVRVVVRLLSEQHLLEVTVSDTGIGIPNDRAEQLFEPFTQADTSITRQFGGTGLGLAITRRLVQLLGGEITVDSRVGVGSSFRFTVATGPLTDVPLASDEPTDDLTPAPSVSLKGKHVLVVDDRRDMRYLLQAYLEEAGAVVTTAPNGAAALEQVKEHDGFDTIVLDMQMPEMDGYAAARKLRDGGFRGRIIALTAHAMKGVRERCLEAGCDEYLTKPVDRVRLFQVIAGASPQTPRSTGQPVDGPRVLVVDDNCDAAEVLSLLLERSGFEVCVANSGAEALVRAGEFIPAAVVLDIGLPDVDGYAVLEHLKTQSTLRDTQYIALTGRSSTQDVQRMRAAGFDHVLVKPADIHELESILRRQRTKGSRDAEP